MIYATTYNPATGQLLQNIVADNQDLLDANVLGQSWLPGLWDTNQYYVQDQQVVAMPPCPDLSNPGCHFDFISKTWCNNLEQQARHVRQQRNMLLTLIDRVNPVWYASLTADQQQELQAYRQALLAVPQQAGFPESVEWPRKPTWL
jgi:hypothetical protein